MDLTGNGSLFLEADGPTLRTVAPVPTFGDATPFPDCLSSRLSNIALMGLIFFCLLVWIVVSTIWKAARQSSERASLVAEFKRNPLLCLVTFGMVLCIFAFGFGIFLPAVGTIPVFDTGWKLWQAGGVGAVLLLLASWSIKER